MQRSIASFATVALSALAADAGHAVTDVQAELAAAVASQPVTDPATSTTSTEPTTEAPAKPKRERKPAKQAASDKPAKPAKPAVAAKPDAATVLADQRAADRELARRYYAGASIAAHRAKASPRDIYQRNALTPVQQCRDGVLTVRDESGLALLLSRADKAGVFCPVNIAFDAGILSRLASVKLIAYDATSDAFSLTDAGRKRARAIVNRANKPA